MRTSTITRKTNETSIEVTLNLDGTGIAAVSTGIGFFDHMLDQLARHSLCDLTVRAKGDLHIDMHHTVEDTGLAIGAALREALGDKRGIARYASADLPMDGTLTRAALDVSGRPFLVWRAAFTAPKVGEMDTELFREFFQALAMAGGLTLHIENFYFDNNHHLAESMFKAVARALRVAVEEDGRVEGVPSTKGVL